MQILVRCPKCDAGLPVSASSLTEPTITCGRCQRVIPLDVSPALRADTQVDRCPVCGGSDFYIRKDLDQKIGVAVVTVDVLISAVFYWYSRDAIAYGVLAALVLFDFVVYRFITFMTVCYRCHAEFRGAYPRTAPAFDLHTADVLEQEYERRIGRR